jgi:NADPH:quinone reductase-like Zn-dependent oxidoreductase
MWDPPTRSLAVASGYDVITTASPANADYVRGLGATQVFNHHDPDVVAQVTDALHGHTVVGAVAIGPGSAKACTDVIARCEGRKFVSIVTAAATLDKDSASVSSFVKGLPRSAAAMTALAVRTHHRRSRLPRCSVPRC